MAKAPKAPGANGPSDVTDVIVRLESVLAAVGDGYWRAYVVRHSLGPIARLTGDGRARLLLAHLGGHAVFVAPALGALAEGLARRGDRDDAARAIAEAEAIVRDAGLRRRSGYFTVSSSCYTFVAPVIAVETSGLLMTQAIAS